MRVQLFIPCFVDQLYPETAFNMIKVLEKACCDVAYNPNQTFISNNLPDYLQGKYSRSYVKLLPNIGGKIVFKRFDFGLDMSAIDINWTYEDSELIPAPPYSRLDITVLSYTSFRLFFNYRF